MSLDLIASVYGETPQGGTTEVPVALTGVDSVFVGGRNLLPKATKTQTIYGVTFTPNPDGSVSVSGTCAGGLSTYNYADNLIPISPNQVVCLSGASQLVKVIINEKTPSGAFVRNVLVDRGQGISGTLTKQKEENILYATLQVQIGDAPNLTIHPMLNLGESPLPYEPYQGSVTQLPIPRPLHKVGDAGDVWQSKLKSVWDKKIIFDGSADEEWLQLGTNLPNKYRYALPLPLGVRADTSNNNAGSNNFPLLAQGQTGDGARGFTIAPYSGEISIIVYSDGGTLESFRSYLAANPMSVWYQSTNYDGTNGLDICLTEYQTGFVELDGTESNLQFNSKYQTLEIKGITTSGDPSQEAAYGVCISSHFALVPPGTSTNLDKIVYGQPKYNQIIIHDTSWNSLEEAKAYFAAQKEAGTPVQIAYQLAAPEVYATDPVDIFVETIFPIVVSDGPITYKVVAHMHPFKTDWKVQPKTVEGYYNGDWFEIEDYNSILDNYQTIYKIAKALYPNLQIPTFVSPTLGAPTKASEINTIERTIDAFKTLTIALSDVGATKTWLDNGNLFNFEDINRWEQVALSYYTVFLGQVELLPKLQFKLGGAQF